MDTGTCLNSPRALGFLGTRQDDYVSLGIDQLDQLRVGLEAKKLLLYIAPKGTGKSWFCIHCGRQALLQKQTVLHVTLEMSEREVIMRYYQNLFGVATHKDKFARALPTVDDLGRVTGFKVVYKSPTLAMTQPGIRKLLASKIKAFGTRFDKLIVKEFPTSFLTVEHLEGYLDYLENVEGFIPNVMIVDYPKLMDAPVRDLRLGIGRNMEGLRGIGVKRNMAVVAPHQGNRGTIGAKRVKSKDSGEDISVVQTADVVMTYSRTPAEERIGTGRLTLEHSRNSRAAAALLLFQSYDIGQYVIESHYMNNKYWEKLKSQGGDMGDDEDDYEE